MKYAFVLHTDDFKKFPDVAREAEDLGWDGVFIADAIAIGGEGMDKFPWFDPWVVLAVMAERTERIKLGTMIAAIPRRRPWKLAREVCTLDHLSNGRIILGVGLGAAKDDGGFSKVGEPMDLKTRAELMDDGLAIMDGLWSGKPFSYKGAHYTVDQMAMLPRPVQKPRVPIWVVGVWPKEKSMQRTLRWDGIIPQKYKASPEGVVNAEDIRRIEEYVSANRKKRSHFDIIAGGTTPGKNRKRTSEIVRPFIDAGATWWIESEWDARKNLARMRLGPPAVGE
ncbi:MAG: LLM class flavin-dependent oxidoreductase [Blastocatellia bacterium]